MSVYPKCVFDNIEEKIDRALADLESKQEEFPDLPNEKVNPKEAYQDTLEHLRVAKNRVSNARCQFNQACSAIPEETDKDAK